MPKSIQTRCRDPKIHNPSLHPAFLLKKEDEQFGTSTIVPSNFEGLVGYRTLRDEGQVPLRAYGCVSGRVSQASVCIAHMACPCHLASFPGLPVHNKTRVSPGTRLRAIHILRTESSVVSAR